MCVSLAAFRRSPPLGRSATERAQPVQPQKNRRHEPLQDLGVQLLAGGVVLQPAGPSASVESAASTDPGAPAAGGGGGGGSDAVSGGVIAAIAVAAAALLLAAGCAGFAVAKRRRRRKRPGASDSSPAAAASSDALEVALVELPPRRAADGERRRGAYDAVPSEPSFPEDSPPPPPRRSDAAPGGRRSFAPPGNSESGPDAAGFGFPTPVAAAPVRRRVGSSDRPTTDDLGAAAAAGPAPSSSAATTAAPVWPRETAVAVIASTTTRSVDASTERGAEPHTTARADVKAALLAALNAAAAAAPPELFAWKYSLEAHYEVGPRTVVAFARDDRQGMTQYAIKCAPQAFGGVIISLRCKRGARSSALRSLSALSACRAPLSRSASFHRRSALPRRRHCRSFPSSVCADAAPPLQVLPVQGRL